METERKHWTFQTDIVCKPNTRERSMLYETGREAFNCFCFFHGAGVWLGSRKTWKSVICRWICNVFNVQEITADWETLPALAYHYCSGVFDYEGNVTSGETKGRKEKLRTNFCSSILPVTFPPLCSSAHSERAGFAVSFTLRDKSVRLHYSTQEAFQNA